MNFDCPTPTRKPSMMASVSGSRISMRRALAGLAVSVDRAAQASMLRRTTSMPTPRPLRLVTFSAVEKPGSKISFRMSASAGTTSRSPGRVPRRAAAPCRGRMPRPSS
jgi:hypothetical protein